MLYSRLFARTLRDVPADIKSASHRLLLQGSYIRSLGQGLYSYLPLGVRVHENLVRIVREEMEALGGQQALAPLVNPMEIWRRSGRAPLVAHDFARFTDCDGHELVLAPTHEEAMVEMVRGTISSYRDLPMFLYQFQTKFRNEERPRCGLVRTREFIMKDGYSFHRTFSDLNNFFPRVFNAYKRIFDTCGVPAIAAEAGVGYMGGDKSYEFLMPSECGDDIVIQCSRCGYTANRDVAVGRREVHLGSPEPLAEVETPGCVTMQRLSSHLDRPLYSLAKSMIYATTRGFAMAVVRADQEVSLEKFSGALKTPVLRLASREELEAKGLVPGFLSPLGLSNGMPVIADIAVADTPNLVIGANVADRHYVNANFGRDFDADEVGDIARVKGGNRCYHCGSKLKEARVMELGNIFRLGDGYSRAMGLQFQEEGGGLGYPHMGAYGIGMGRLMAAVVEANHDKKGILWPPDIAPFRYFLMAIGRAFRVKSVADAIYDQLSPNLLYDDRRESIGTNYKDSDLLGIPFRVVVSAKSLDEGKVEVSERRSDRIFKIDPDRVLQLLSDLEKGRV